MKKEVLPIIVSLVAILSLFPSTTLWAADGDIFTAKTVEDMELNFKVISEEDKTCMVGTDNDTYLNAIFWPSTGGHITIPENANGYRVTCIGSLAFSNCKWLTSVTIPSSVTIIRGGAFFWCSSLTSIDIPEGVTVIEDYTKYGNNYGTFQDCASLTSITIPSTVTSIGNIAFTGCYAIERITVAEGNTAYDSRDNCNALIETASNTLIKGSNSSFIPEGVTSIGDGAFAGCTGLTGITIPKGVTSIGREAFSGCAGLTSIDIPESVTSIGYYAFNACIALESITVAAGNTVYDSRNDCNALIETASNSLVKGCNKTVIPEGVTSIGNYAFSGCISLTSINIPSSVASIGSLAFYQCTGLTSIIIPEGVTRIGSSAFENCTGLTSLTISESVASIGILAFYGCTGLERIVVAEGNTVYDSRNNCNALIETARNALVKGCNKTVIPEGVTSIGYSAFLNCTGLTSINIPSSVTSIGNEAFRGCTGLTSINIPSGVTNIGESAFDGCTGLTSIDIPSSVTNIGSHTFSGCSGLTSVTYNCAVVADWFLVNESIKEITLGENVKTIYFGAFRCLRGLTSITILSPNLTFYESDAFSNCPNLASVSIKGSNVGNWFSGIKSIKEVTLGEDVTSIDGNAFNDCTGITSVTSLIRKPFKIGANTFSVYNTATLYVPKGTKLKYETTSAWSQFGNIEEVEVSVRPKGDVNSDYAVDVADISTVIDVMSGNTNVSSATADVNKDGAVDVADISNIISIMANAGYFYLGTTRPTAENYKTLPGVVDYYTSIEEAKGEMASVDAGETLYMLCPASWMDGGNVTIEDNSGNIVFFLEDLDAETIPGYVIYKTPSWSEATTVKLTIGYVEVKSVDFSTMSDGEYDGTIEKGKAEIVNYEGQNCLKVNMSSHVRIIEGFEVDPLTDYTTTFWVKADKDAKFNITFSGNRINGPSTNGLWDLKAGEWTKIVVEGQPAEGETEGYLRIENLRLSDLYISKVQVGKP